MTWLPSTGANIIQVLQKPENLRYPCVWVWGPPEAYPRQGFICALIWEMNRDSGEIGKGKKPRQGDKQVTAGDNGGPRLGMVENGTSEWWGHGTESTQENGEMAILSLLFSAVLCVFSESRILIWPSDRFCSTPLTWIWSETTHCLSKVQRLSSSAPSHTVTQ